MTTSTPPAIVAPVALERACLDMLESEIIVQPGGSVPAGHEKETEGMTFPGNRAISELTENIYRRHSGEKIHVNPGERIEMHEGDNPFYVVCGYDANGKHYVRVYRSK